jgi:hypothetical protein
MIYRIIRSHNRKKFNEFFYIYIYIYGVQVLLYTPQHFVQFI